MNIKEYGFALTTGASVVISRLCPDGDISRIVDALSGAYGDTIETMCSIIVALNGGYVAQEKMCGREAKRITAEELLALSPSDFMEVQQTALKAFGVDLKGEIEVVSEKKAGVEG